MLEIINNIILNHFPFLQSEYALKWVYIYKFLRSFIGDKALEKQERFTFLCMSVLSKTKVLTLVYFILCFKKN